MPAFLFLPFRVRLQPGRLTMPLVRVSTNDAVPPTLCHSLDDSIAQEQFPDIAQHHLYQG